MKIVTFSHNGKISSGYLEKDEVVVCGDGVNVVQSLIERGGLESLHGLIMAPIRRPE